MLFNVEKQSLLKAISYAYSIIEKKSSISVLSYVLLEANDETLVIKSTDLDNSIIIKMDADVKVGGSVLIVAQTCYDILRKISDGIITFESLENYIVVTSKEVKFTLNTLSPEEFPEIAYLKESRKFSIKSDVLKKLLNMTYFAMSQDESRYNLNGVLLHSESSKISAVATDVHRLSLVTEDCESVSENLHFILSRKTVNECRKMLDSVEGDVDVFFNDVYVSFNFGSMIFISRLVDGNFPEYQHIIPKELNMHNFTIAKKSLMDALSRVSIIVDEKSPVVRMVIKTGAIEINVANTAKGNAEEKILVDYAGDEETLGFNPRYIMDILTNVDSEELVVFFKDSLSATILKAKDDDTMIFMVMPMLVN